MQLLHKSIIIQSINHLQLDNIQGDDSADFDRDGEDDRDEEEPHQTRTLRSASDPTEQSGEEKHETQSHNHVSKYLKTSLIQ